MRRSSKAFERKPREWMTKDLVEKSGKRSERHRDEGCCRGRAGSYATTVAFFSSSAMELRRPASARNIPLPTPTPEPNANLQPPPRQVLNDTAILNALAGTYSLVNTSSTLNGVSIPDLPYGEAPVGLLIYTATGFMSATITATEPEFRPNLTFPYQANDTDADWARVGKHQHWGQIFHGPLTVANVPTWVGQNHRRNYTVVEVEEEGTIVKYLRIGSERGGGYRGVLWWKRLA
ncbi:unnamed protein product [Alternaria alternata]